MDNHISVFPTSERTRMAVSPIISCALMGGLGNQLFQMAAVFGTGAKLKRKPVVHEPSISNTAAIHSQERYVDTIFALWPKVHEPCDACFAQPDCDIFLHVPVPDINVHHLSLCGYFQNEGFIKEHMREFVNTLTLPKDVHELPNTCFIHIRRGDKVGHSLHYVDLHGRYLTEAMRMQRDLRPGVQFMVFSDDMKTCCDYPQLKSPDVHFTAETNEVRALVQMTQCEAGGICWNSSFSWWGAYMNWNPSRTIIFPSRWVNNDWKTDIQFAGSVILQV
jgi:hypothetical protein